MPHAHHLHHGPHLRQAQRRAALLKKVLYAVLFPLFLWQSSVLGEVADPLLAVVPALENLDATNLDDDWYFTMEVAEEGELRVIGSDPRRDTYDRRQLLSVDGVVADQQRQKAFRDKEVERIDELDPDTSGYRYMVDAQTLQLVERSNGYATLSFVPRIKALDKARDQLRGSVLLNLDSGQIEEIEIYNTAELSPAFSVTVDTYRLVLGFRQEQGENLLSKLESHAVGKAGFLKRFDVMVAINFREYQRAQP